MQTFLTITLTSLSIFVVATHAFVGKGHFKSASMPAGANLVSVAVIVTLIAFTVLLWVGSPPPAAQAAGIAFELAALWLFHQTIAASRAGKLKFAFDTGQPESLVTEGPYRYVRHPFYVSYLIFWLGLAIGAWSPWGIALLAMMLTLYVVAARGEEQKFANSPLAGEYAAYRARTGMFVPRFGR